jgi:hypothetical protein
MALKIIPLLKIWTGFQAGQEKMIKNSTIID